MSARRDEEYRKIPEPGEVTSFRQPASGHGLLQLDLTTVYFLKKLVATVNEDDYTQLFRKTALPNKLPPGCKTTRNGQFKSQGIFSEENPFVRPLKHC